MPSLHRIPEKQEVDENALTVFSKVARLGGFAAAKRIQKIMGGRVAREMRVLDIGTGPASIPLNLKRFFPDVRFTGLDISIGMLEKARENRRIIGKHIDLLAGNGERLPFRRESVDIITTLFALHHMDHPGHFLKEVNRVLKPNGVFLSIDFRRDMPGILYHAFNILWQGVFFFSSGRFGIRESILASWSPVEIKQILEEHGLDGFTVHTNWMELWIYKGLQ